MIRRLRTWGIPSFLAVFLWAAPGSAQERVGFSQPAGSGSVIEFSYGWTEGPTVRPDGSLHFQNYPVVKEVARDSPASEAGIRSGDVIVSVNGRDGRTPPLFEDIRPEEPVVLRVRRGDEEREIRFVPRRKK